VLSLGRAQSAAALPPDEELLPDDELVLEVALLAAAEAPALDDPPLSPLPASDATLRLLPLLKSVSYQPPPLRRKPAAETFLLRAS
jgi:hypothetical protein